MLIRLKDFPLILVLITGLLSSVGSLFGVPVLNSIGRLTSASPEGLVFTSHRGLPTFGLSYDFNFTFENELPTNLVLDRKVYRKLQGPFMRRNVYGGALSYSIVLRTSQQKKWLSNIFSYGFCQPGPLRKDFFLKDNLTKGVINVSHNQKLVSTIEFICQK